MAGGVLRTGRGRSPKLASDARGIALQTVIVMVVLLGDRGAVAAVLLTRGGEAVSEIERQQITRSAAEYPNEALCEAAQFSWDGASCVPKSVAPTPPDVATLTTKTLCEAAKTNFAAENYMWNLDTDTNVPRRDRRHVL